MSESVLVALATIIVFGVAAQWIAWRLGVPSILLLLIAGFVAGPVTGLVDPDRLFGDLLLPVVSLSVGLILYEGGLSLKVSELSEVGGVVRNLVSVGMLITWAVGAAAASILFGLGAALSVLLGAILAVTGPTVIQPLLRNIRPIGSVGSVLKWEGIVIDPIAALLAVLVFEAILTGEPKAATAHVAAALLKTVFVAGGLGLLAAAALTLLIHRYWIPDFLQNAASLMFVVAVLTVSNSVQHESGLLAVTVMGIALANQKYADIRHIVEFKENLRVLLISTIFIVLAARVQFSDLQGVGVRGAIFVAVLVLVGRPLSVFISTLASRMSVPERVFVACMAPRGIVAAAVASVFALRLEEANYEQAHLLVPIAFVTIVGTVLVYGTIAPVIARRLGVADANPQGILFVGAHPWVRALAETMHANGQRVLLVDTNRHNSAAARMGGLPSYTGSILSDRALDDMDLSGIGRLFAVTANEWVNVLAVQRFAPLFGRAECYQLPPDDDPTTRGSGHKHMHGRWLFGPDVTPSTIERRFADGAVFKATPLTESFGYAEFVAMYGEDAIEMLLVEENDTVRVVAADDYREPQPGDTLISLSTDPD